MMVNAKCDKCAKLNVKPGVWRIVLEKKQVNMVFKRCERWAVNRSIHLLKVFIYWEKIALGEFISHTLDQLQDEASQPA